jgi:hypothetical protein
VFVDDGDERFQDFQIAQRSPVRRARVHSLADDDRGRPDGPTTGWPVPFAALRSE